MDHSYDWDLVAMSFAVATMASFLSLDLAGRVATAGPASRYWLYGGAVALGAGLWAVHFIGLLAVRVPQPLAYDLGLTGLALLLAISTCGVGLRLAGGKALPGRVLVPGALLMAAGLCGLNYVGLAAVLTGRPVRFDPVLLAATAMVALLASMMAVSLAYTMRSSAQHPLQQRILAAATMAVALVGVHYVGLQAAQLPRAAGGDSAFHQVGDYLGHGIGIAILLTLSLTLLSSLFDARYRARIGRILGELRESEHRYRLLLETTTDAVLLVDEHGTIRYANPPVEQVFGYRPRELAGRPLSLLQPERHRRAHLEGFRRYLRGGERRLNWRAIELQGLRRDGIEFPLELSMGEVQLGGTRQFAAFLRDTSRQKEREAGIARLTRMQTVLSATNGLITRARSRQLLFDEACRIAVEQGQFRMAMIGLVAGGRIEPVAVAGVDEGYVENLNIDLAGAGPTATAMRQKSPCVCNDIAADPAMAQWREAALQRGYRASASFPLLEGGRLAGCMNLYAPDPDFFDAVEQGLLDQLARDISHGLDVIARDEQIDYLAYYDPLTRQANRKLMIQRLEQQLDAARRSRGKLALLKVDVTHFQAVNNAVGHAGGDVVLKALAERIVAFAGNPDHVARMHGDRFALLLTELPEALAQMPRRLEPLWAALARPIAVAGRELRISVNAGVALFPDDGDDAESLLRNAEAALKMAKSAKETVLYYKREMSAAISERRSLEERLRQAFERNELGLHYQPKVSLGSGAISGAEALLRWSSPELGLVSPDRFVGMLEDTGMILQVGTWALRQAAADYRRWRGQGLPAPRIAVNLSPIQLRRDDFVQVLSEALGADGAAAGVDLEITESAMMTDIERHIDKLKAARALGVSIAIDDFGTGYSSLAYLNKLPISALKIDRSFIVQMTENPDTMNIVSTIISLAHTMGLKVIAEGVDSKEQLKFLRLLRCDEMQGFLFSGGVPEQEFAGMLRSGRQLQL